jgi:PKD repeat protein
MSASKSFGFLLVTVAVLALGPVSEVVATPAKHVDGGGRETPWTNCTACHGADLMGGVVDVSCFDCHNPFASPDPPPRGHDLVPGHSSFDIDDRLTPFDSGCTTCHGDDLTGDLGPSCFTCHDQLWSSGGGENSPPDVDKGGPYSGEPGVAVQFDASGTTDADGDELFYLWVFADGSTPQLPSKLPTISHVFKNAGTYSAILSVTDGVNNPVVVNFTVAIGTGGGNSPPTADAGGPYSGNTGQAIQFDASGSSDPDGDSLTYSWNFGDGSNPTSPSSSATATHTYTSGGTFTATVTVDDGVNSTRNDSATVEITVVVNEPPNAVAGGPYSGKAGQAVQFDGSGSSDPDGDSLSFIWSFGDGGLPTFPNATGKATHTYQNPGTYTAVLTVTDGTNVPVFVNTTVEISAAGGTPPGMEAGDWLIEVPLAMGQLVVSFREFAGILLVETTPTGGTTSFGVGMEFDGLIFWMDLTGALFFGDIDHEAGTMWGVVFGYPGGSSPYFGERQQ